MKKDKNLVIGYVPFGVSDNDYTVLMKNALGRFGEVRRVTSTFFLSWIWGSRFDLLVLNWTDNGFMRKKNGSVFFFGVVREFLSLVVYGIISKRLIFVRHNVFPHGANPNSASNLKRLIDFYERFFDAVWIHSGHLGGRFRDYIPFPVYSKNSIDNSEMLPSSLPSNYYVIFGRILPYKKIEDFLGLIPHDLNVVVIGSAPDPEYLKIVASYASKNVIVVPGYISDSVASRIVGASRGMVISNADKDMIVSASMFYGLSHGVPVFALNTDFIRWLSNKDFAKCVRAFDSLEAMVEALINIPMYFAKEDFELAQREFSADVVAESVNTALRRLGLVE